MKKILKIKMLGKWWVVGDYLSDKKYPFYLPEYDGGEWVSNLDIEDIRLVDESECEYKLKDRLLEDKIAVIEKLSQDDDLLEAMDKYAGKVKIEKLPYFGDQVDMNIDVVIDKINELTKILENHINKGG